MLCELTFPFFLQASELVFIGDYELPVKLELEDSEEGVKAWRFTRKTANSALLGDSKVLQPAAVAEELE